MSSSSNAIDFSVRQNKAIERSVVFGALRRLHRVIDYAASVYIGLGSAWFIDFEHAHRDLGIQTMISIEGDEVVYSRAVFNRPYRTVEVIHGMSHDETPKLLEREDLAGRPWVVWLGYDEPLDGTKVDELTSLVRRAPDDSILLTTFNADPRSYGDTRQERLSALEDLFKDAFASERYPDGAGLAKHAAFQAALAEALLAMLVSADRTARRLGGFAPAFNLHYRDGAPMVTVGGVLPASGHRDAVSGVLASSSWRGMPREPINSPPLTPREISALRSLLPSDNSLTRQDVKALGFDLQEKNLASFVEYYLDYPMYVQTVR